MNCGEIRARMDAHLDGEIDAGERDGIEVHLAGCPACRADYEQRRGLAQRIGAVPRFRAPDELRSWAQALGRAGGRAWTGRPYAVAAALVLALALGAGLGGGVAWRYAGLHSGRSPAAELVASHVRSQLAPGRLTDVASSDRHVVKPWFNGRLDFAPPVLDFTTDGFPLLGGRMDYVGGRAVAALVYRHRQHTIDLFVWPAAEAGDAAVARATDRGYTVLGWRRAGMEYRLVSDLNAPSLDAFSRILQRP